MAQLVKNAPAMRETCLGLIPGLGRSPGERKCCPPQYSGLENSMDYIVHGGQRVRQDWATFTFTFTFNLIFKEAKDLNRHFTKEDIQMDNRFMSSCSTSWIRREMQIKTMMKHHLISVRVGFIKKTTDNKLCKDAEKRESLNTVGRSVDWYSHYGKQYGGSSKN